MGIQAINGGMKISPQEMFKKLDSNSDGGIDKNEFLANAKQKDGVQDLNAEKMFAKIDSNSDGKIDNAENTSAMQQIAAKGTRPSKPQGPPPCGGSKSSTSSSSKTSGSSKSYDEKDLNQDGSVSASEKMQYALKLLQEVEKEQEETRNYNQTGKASDSYAAVQNIFEIKV